MHSDTYRTIYFFWISDRKKDLVKLQAGEYVSLGKVETALKASSVIDDICVYGESSKHFVVALIVPNPKGLQALASQEGLPETKFEELCESPVVNKAVLKEIADQARKGSVKLKLINANNDDSNNLLWKISGNLQKFEVPAAVTLCKEIWTPESGLVTAAFKLKRKEIQIHYQKDINKMYA